MIWLIIYVVGFGITAGILYTTWEDASADSLAVAIFWPLIPLVMLGIVIGDKIKERSKP